MRRTSRFIFAAMLAGVICVPAWSQDEGAVALGGAVSGEDRASVASSPDLTFQDYQLDLSVDARPVDKALVHAEAWINSPGLASNVLTAADLVDLARVAPVTPDLREAYFEIKGFVLDNVDVKIGRQRIAWGTADQLNPTDNINPLNLSDIWDFSNHLGSDAVQLSVYLWGIDVSGVVVPVFTPSVLPHGSWGAALLSSAFELPGVSIGAVTTSVTLPESSIAENTSAGVRIKGNVLGCDLSVSYLYGRQSLPVVDSIVVTPTSTLGVVDVATGLIYPREHIVGADLATSLWGMGLWAEAAVFVPEKVTLTEDFRALGMGVQSLVALDGAPYVKYIVGADYTFPGDVYLNGQYLHGFVQESGAANLQDYFVVDLQWRLLDERLILTPFSGVIEIKNWSDVQNNYAIVAAPSITAKPVDNVEITVGYHWIKGTGTTTFGVLDGTSEVFAKASYKF